MKSVTKQMTKEGGKSRDARRSLPAGARKRQPAVNHGHLKVEPRIVGDLHHLREAAGRGQKVRPGMSVCPWSEDMILVDLPGELEEQNELQTVIGIVRERGDCDVVIDFSHVDVVGGACLAGLVEVRRLLNDCGHKLTLCGVAPAIKGVFTIARLDDLFEFAEDRFAALASLQMIG